MIQSATAGHVAENVLDRFFHAAARAAFVADIWKVPTPTQWSKGKLVYSAESVSDYVGQKLDGTGRMIAEEAKATDKDVFYMSALKSHQRGFLERTWNAKGIALLSIIGKQGVWCFHWPDVRDASSITMRAHMDRAVTPESYVSRLQTL